MITTKIITSVFVDVEEIGRRRNKYESWRKKDIALALKILIKGIPNP